MGRMPKPADVRQNRHQRPEVGELAVPMLPAPPASRHWLKRTADDWEAYWRNPVSTLVQRDGGELSAVRRLFDYRDEHARALHAFRKQRMTKGSMGQERLSPSFDAMQKLEKMMLPLEDRFALSSMARLRLGATYGDAEMSLAQLNAALSEGDDDVNDTQDTVIIDLPGLPKAQ